MATAVLDVDYLSAYLSVPQETISTAIDAPTAELVRSILEAVTAKAREHDELAADKLRLDIELENAVRSSETRIEGLRANVEKAQKTVEEVRTKLSEEESARSSLETELQTLKSSSSTSTSEVETLRARIATLEAANRDTLAVLESKSTANDELANELQKQHKKGLELGQQLSTLQQTVQTANSAVSSAKFREQSLKQEIELAKRNSEWFENELKTKTAEALKSRKEKGARISELQRLNEEATSNVDALKKTEQALRTRLEEVQKKAEESLEKVQQLEEAAAKTEEGFRQELESSRRLSELQAQQTETHRNRLKEVEAELEKAKDEAAEEIGRCRQEVEFERQGREQADNRIAELEAEVDRLEALVSSQPRPGSVPGTPRQGLNGSMFGRAGSPAQFGTPGSVRSKSAVTATQAIEELYKVKGQLTTEKRRGDRLAAELDDVMQALEAKQPELEELQAEHERLQQEVIEMSTVADQSGKERDRAKKDARKAENEASTAQAEVNILRQQLRDLSVQIKMLLCELDARERGLDALTPAERSQLERLARGEVGEDAFQGLTDTDRFISQRLTVFRDVSDLQEKNQELLKITRQLGAQMESEEALAAKNQAAKDHEEVRSLQGKIEDYKDEIQAVITRSESYVKERDMFRRMLQHRGQLPPTSDLASMFGQSVDVSTNGVVQTVEQGSRDNANYAVLLRELQAHFDQYRNEQAVDRRTMKEQVETLSKEKGALQSEIAKTKSQLTLAVERHDLLQSNYAMIQKENVELQSRSQSLSEASAKQDLRTQQVAEDLIEAKGLLESMRNENANLKAEKKLWKEIQDRLNQDNEVLMNERTRLNTLVANQQTLQNERELTDSETRRRLQSQVEALETELSTTKRKLNDELEDHKKTQLRKEYDSQQSQKRIDDLASSLGQVREELVAAKTTRDHLQSRVDELAIELKSAEERVGLLQPRPTPRPNVNDNVTDDNTEGDLIREQELAIEVSELKRDLELAKAELENTKHQMETYKSISQSTEEELQSLNATQDQYREEMDSIVEEKDTKIRELQQRADDISAELTNTNNELTTLRNQQSEVARQAEEEKVALETEISRLKDEDEKHATAAQYHQQDLRAQAAIATKAQQDYENELVKHAEAAKLLQNLRTEHNLLKSQSATLRAEAESAKLALSQSESSWEDRREQFEQELKELRTRRDDLNSQNKVLHQQLEDVGAQISALQQSRATADHSDINTAPTESTNDRAADGLREVNSFLRREKEIIEVQYDLKIQEAKRLQQQLDYAQAQLDETRLKLDQERRLHADGPRSSTAHKDLMDKLNELNLVREASVTLRNEARQAEARLAEKTKRVEELTEQIQPLEVKIRELEHEKETMDGEMRLLQEDRDRWQKRTQDIISKYDRIDPQEMEQLKETIESLRVERDSLLAEMEPFQEQIRTLEAEKAAWSQSRTKLIEQAKERNRINMKENKDRTAERDAAIQDKDALQEQLNGLKQELETAITEKETAQQEVNSLSQEIEMVKSERDRALSSAAKSPQVPATTEAPSQTDPAIDQQLTDLRQQLQQITQEKQSIQAQLQDLRAQLEKANSDRDAALAEAAEVKAKSIQHTSQDSDTTMQNGAEEGQIDETPSAGVSDEERKTLEERIAAAEAKAKEQEARAAQVEATMEATLKTRSDKMKTALNNKLVESKEAQKTKLEAEYKLKFEQEKQIWLAETNASSTNVSNGPPPEQAKSESEAQAPPTTPGTPQKTSAAISADALNMTDLQVRDLIAKHPTGRQIVVENVKKQVAAQTQKIKDEHAKVIGELQQKSESSKAQAVAMEGKKSVVRISIFENKAKTATGKLEIVEKAAQETPQRPVVEVWEEVKVYRLPPPPPVVAAAPQTAPAASVAASNNDSVTTANGISSSTPTLKLREVKNEAPSPATTQQSSIPSVSNGAPSVPASNIPGAPHSNTGGAQRGSSIPTMRGNASLRGRGGNQLYQPRGGAQGGRGRGGAQQQRGALNAGAPTFSPTGPAGVKRAREEGSMGGPQQGNAGKRPRGGG